MSENKDYEIKKDIVIKDTLNDLIYFKNSLIKLYNIVIDNSTNKKKGYIIIINPKEGRYKNIFYFYTEKEKQKENRSVTFDSDILNNIFNLKSLKTFIKENETKTEPETILDFFKKLTELTQEISDLKNKIVKYINKKNLFESIKIEIEKYEKLKQSNSKEQQEKQQQNISNLVEKINKEKIEEIDKDFIDKKIEEIDKVFIDKKIEELNKYLITLINITENDCKNIDKYILNKKYILDNYICYLKREQKEKEKIKKNIEEQNIKIYKKLKVFQRILPIPYINSKGNRIGDIQTFIKGKIPYDSTSPVNYFLYNTFKYINDVENKDINTFFPKYDTNNEVITIEHKTKEQNKIERDERLESYNQIEKLFNNLNIIKDDLGELGNAEDNTEDIKDFNDITKEIEDKIEDINKNTELSEQKKEQKIRKKLSIYYKSIYELLKKIHENNFNINKTDKKSINIGLKNNNVVAAAGGRKNSYSSKKNKNKKIIKNNKTKKYKK